MSQEEITLIDIEKQDMDQEHHEIEITTQPSKRYLSRASVFSPPNADNLTSKLKLSRRQLNKIRNRKKKSAEPFYQADGEEQNELFTLKSRSK